MQVLFLFVLCYIVVYFDFAYCDKEQKCFPKKDKYKRPFYVGEIDMSFRIEVSQRISHQLVSNIAHILLEEVLGYQHVDLVEQDEENTLKTLQKISTCDNPNSCSDVDETGPELTLNLELWVPPGYNLQSWINTGRVEDCGPLGPIGRTGWFIEERVVAHFWRENFTAIDHYKAFLNTEITRYFDLSSDVFIVDKANKTCQKSHKSLNFACGNDGFYRPPQCQTHQSACATILADYPNSTFLALEKIINHFKLFVNIAWLGADYEKMLTSMIADPQGPDKRYILFYHKNPMVLNSVVPVVHVSFPGCENFPFLCQFEAIQMQKVVWSEVKMNAPHAFHTLQALSLSQEQYKNLLYLYYKNINRVGTLRAVVCDWLKENELLWFQDWIPEDHDQKTILYIGGIFPIGGMYWTQNSVIEAAVMAADAINNRSSILPNYTLKILEQDGHCQTDEVIRSFIHYVQSRTFKTMVGILGPACSDTVEPIAGVATLFKTFIISYSAEGALLNSQEKYPFFFRTIPDNNMFRFVYVKLLKKLGFARIAALTEEGQKYPEYLSYLQGLMESNGMTFIENRKFSPSRTFVDMTDYLEGLKKKGARIIIGDFYDYAARSVMCTAYKLHMTAANGYIWFLPSWYPADWYDTDEKNHIQNISDNVPCTTNEMVEAINGHMSLSYKFYAEDDTIMQENKSVGKWKEDYDKLVKKKVRNDRIISDYGGYTYDAVWVYALAMDILLKENESHIATLHTNRTAGRLTDILRDTNFSGVTGHLYFQNGSRISDVLIWQWVNRTRNLIGVYQAYSPDDGVLDFNESNIIWLTPNRQKPSDGSIGPEECEMQAFQDFLGTTCSTAKTVANILGIASFIVSILVIIIVIKRRYDKRVEMAEKKFKELGIPLPLALDEWELPRDHIVMNRKLGEGAFGTVYGGEALVRNKGWIAVAVKTLKRGAKSEEKLDFLSEAEVMKQFDHINIVKLVGVCTTGEPVYTVMEFMLYGDLKTYLLSRRHMASEKDRFKNEEVSDKRLTNMALDIARGLSYLAEQNYVHRDLACRNCLVNTARSVKIADFGMCRAMYDSDYYRHNKKGMMPIRWMAPESLIDGLFTSSSDVWSYGVVLYEIITFASFPYKGLSNDQVMNHVKNHKTLPVPKGIKFELERLLLKCWSSVPQQRPQAAEIVETLALNPELITPCLDVPAASVYLEDSASISGLDAQRARGHSFSSVWQMHKTVSACHNPTQNHLSVLDASQLLQTAHPVRHMGLKHPNKRSLHESFKKAKGSHQDKTEDSLPQITSL